VLHDRVADTLHEIAAPQRMINLLFLLLERLSVRHGLRTSSNIGLPVDEFDCSRKLAHMVLYPHDDTMVERVGADRYVRWMDDQIIGAESHPEGLSILACLSKSLTTLHLTPNSGKTKLLTTAKARQHYHLVTNERLDEIDKLVKAKDVRGAGKKLHKCWLKAKKDEGVGEWGEDPFQNISFGGRHRAKTMA